MAKIRRSRFSKLPHQTLILVLAALSVSCAGKTNESGGAGGRATETRHIEITATSTDTDVTVTPSTPEDIEHTAACRSRMRQETEDNHATELLDTTAMILRGEGRGHWVLSNIHYYYSDVNQFSVSTHTDLSPAADEASQPRVAYPTVDCLNLGRAWPDPIQIRFSSLYEIRQRDQMALSDFRYQYGINRDRTIFISADQNSPVTPGLNLNAAQEQANHSSRYFGSTERFFRTRDGSLMSVSIETSATSVQHIVKYFRNIEDSSSAQVSQSTVNTPSTQEWGSPSESASSAGEGTPAGESAPTTPAPTPSAEAAIPAPAPASGSSTCDNPITTLISQTHAREVRGTLQSILRGNRRGSWTLQKAYFYHTDDNGFAVGAHADLSSRTVRRQTTFNATPVVDCLTLGSVYPDPIGINLEGPFRIAKANVRTVDWLNYRFSISIDGQASAETQDQMVYQAGNSIMLFRSDVSAVATGERKFYSLPRGNLLMVEIDRGQTHQTQYRAMVYSSSTGAQALSQPFH